MRHHLLPRVRAPLIALVIGAGCSRAEEKVAPAPEPVSTLVAAPVAQTPTVPKTVPKAPTAPPPLGGGSATLPLLPATPPVPTAPAPATPIELAAVATPGAVSSGAIPDVAGVPRMHFDPHDPEAAALANKAGLARNKVDDLPGAVAEYVRALEADGSHVLARYNLACAFARMGDARAKAVLGQLAAAGCNACLGRVAAAPDDPDFAALKDDPELREMASDAAARRARGDVAVFNAQLAPGDTTTAAWTPLRTNASFQLGDRLSLSWKRPVRVTHIDVTRSDCGDAWTTLVTFPNAPPQELDDEGHLSTPVVTTALTMMVTAVDSELFCVPPAMEVVVHGTAPDVVTGDGSAEAAEADAAAGDPDAPAFDLSWSEDDSTVEVVGFPLVSTDGAFVAFVESPEAEDYDRRDTVLKVVRAATGAIAWETRLERGWPGDSGPDDDPNAAKRVAAAKQKLETSATGWAPMSAAGGGDSWFSQPGLPTGLFANFNGTQLRVVNASGELLHRSDRPRWAVPPASFNPDGEPVSIRFGGAWVDASRKTLVYRVGFHPGRCAGGDVYAWHLVAL
jgi:hypothetical protein